MYVKCKIDHKYPFVYATHVWELINIVLTKLIKIWPKCNLECKYLLRVLLFSVSFVADFVNHKDKVYECDLV